MWDTYIITDMLVVEESELNLIFIYQATLSWEIENIVGLNCLIYKISTQHKKHLANIGQNNFLNFQQNIETHNRNFQTKARFSNDPQNYY